MSKVKWLGTSVAKYVEAQEKKREAAQRPGQWILDGLSPKHASVFADAFGSMVGGDLTASAVYVLDSWKERGPGRTWALMPVLEPQAEEGRAEEILSKCFAFTRKAVRVLANQKFGGSCEKAVCAAIAEQIVTGGLDRV